MNEITRKHVGPRMSQSVEHNGVVYIAGQVGDDQGADVAAQTRQVLAKIDAPPRRVRHRQVQAPVGPALGDGHAQLRRDERGVGCVDRPHEPAGSRRTVQRPRRARLEGRDHGDGRQVEGVTHGQQAGAMKLTVHFDRPGGLPRRHHHEASTTAHRVLPRQRGPRRGARALPARSVLRDQVRSHHALSPGTRCSRARRCSGSQSAAPGSIISAPGTPTGSS